MGDAPGQRANGLELLRLAQLRLQPRALGRRLMASSRVLQRASHAVGLRIGIADRHAALAVPYLFIIGAEQAVLHAAYKDGAPGAEGFAPSRLPLRWVVPFHPAAVRALKEAGIWTEEAQRHNDQLLKRQAVLEQAWRELRNGPVPEGKVEFEKAWMSKRRQALSNADMEPGFD